MYYFDTISAILFSYYSWKYYFDTILSTIFILRDKNTIFILFQAAGEARGGQAGSQNSMRIVFFSHTIFILFPK